MDEEERKKIIAEIDARRQELDILRAKLNALNVEKESWFDKKRAATRQIFDTSKDIHDAKGKRNTFTKQVKDSKQRRQELNTALKDKLAEMTKLQNEKQAITKKFGIRVDPSKIQQEIEQFEFRIETEGLPFSVEQAMMKRIAERKKVLEQAREVSDVFERIHKLNKELQKIRQKADETHKKVQSKAEMSQQFHENLVESSTEIKDLRAKEEEALKKFVELKGQWNEQNTLVKAKMDEINTLRAKLGDVAFEEKKKAKAAEHKKIAEKEQSVEDKIKKGMKLTTEDLLVYQAREQMSQAPSRDRREQKRRPERKEETKTAKTEVKKETAPKEESPQQS
jgi:uncharacterized coiled-coil DUF342 family protein